MHPLRLGILGSGRGSNCRAILESIQSGTLRAEARVVISDVLDAPILEIAKDFQIPNAYLPPGQFRTRLEPAVEMELVKLLRGAEVEPLPWQPHSLLLPTRPPFFAGSFAPSHPRGSGLGRSPISAAFLKAGR